MTRDLVGIARRTGATVVLTALAFVPLAPLTLAQEIGEPPPEETSDRLNLVGELRLPEDLVPTGTGSGVNTSDLWVWPEGRLAYMVSGNGLPTLEAARLGDRTRRGLVAFHLDTLQEVARTDPDAERFPSWIERELALGRSAGFAMDRESGLLFVPHHNAIRYGFDDGLLEGDLLGGVDDEASAAQANQALCYSSGATLVDRPCFAGVYVIDARTLEVKGDIPFYQAGLDAAGVQLNLMAMTHTPVRGEGGKLHVLLEEGGTSALAWAEQVGADPYTRGRVNQQYAAQIDVASGRTDWVYRLSPCVGYPGAHGVREGPLGAIYRSVDPERPVVWVGCFAGGTQISTIVRLDLDDSEQAVLGQQAFIGPGRAAVFRADPDSERIFVKTVSGEALWWAFDGLEGGFVARVGIGPDTARLTSDALDPSSGRLYTFARNLSEQERGLGWVDVRRTQLPQYTWDPSLAGRYPADGGQAGIRLAVDPPGDGRQRRVFLRPSTTAPSFLVLEDPVPISTDPSRAEAAVSDDVPEAPGATDTAFSASARAYGARLILVSGLAGVTGRHSSTTTFAPYMSGCNDTSRMATFGLSGSPEQGQRAEIDTLGTAVATAQATYADSTTEDDLDGPYSRCRLHLMPEWEELLRGVRVRAGADEPGAGMRPGREPSDSPLPGATQVSCSSPDSTADRAEDALFPGLSAEVSCHEAAIAAESRARLLDIGPVDIAEAGSTFQVDRRDGGGVVANVESWVRGVTIVGEQGTVTIDGIRALATAWANGRAQPEDVAGHANCDDARTAGSCYQRVFSGVTVVDGEGKTAYSCEQCADPENQRQLVFAMQSALGSGWLVSAPDPDQELAAGAADGSQAAVLKRSTTRFADATLKGDLLPTMPALELVRINDTTDIGGGIAPGGANRQVFQLAGVEADLSYAISCLLTIVNGECAGEPSSLTIDLTDPLGLPLPGGGFEVHQAGEDGVLDLEATLGEPLVCVTGPDGSCGFEEMTPGTYVVQQVAAPDGYLPMEDQVIDLPPGGQGTLSVVNGTLPVTGIAISLTDLDGDALEGADFEVLAGEEVADDAVALVTCSTDEDGVCRFPAPALDLVEAPLPLDLVTAAVPDAPAGLLQVPPGGYTVRQASAPEGYEPVEDIGFDLAEGQIARVELSNAPPFVPGDEDVVADTNAAGEVFDAGPVSDIQPVAFTAQPPVAEPAFTVEFPDLDGDVPLAAGPEDSGSLGQRILTLPGNAARFALRHPKEALAFGGVLLLFAAAAAGVHRRRLLLELLNT